MWPFARPGQSKHGTANIESGLKALDLFVPLQPGDDILVSGEAKSGAKILGNELAYRLMSLPVRRFRVFIFLDSELEDLESRARELQEIMPDFQDIFIRSTVTATEIRELRSQSTSSSQDALFCISENERFIHVFRQSVHADRAATSGSKGLTSCVIAEAEHALHYDARIISSRIIAQEGVYPALDARLSSPSETADRAQTNKPAPSLPSTLRRTQMFADRVISRSVERSKVAV